MSIHRAEERHHESAVDRSAWHSYDPGSRAPRLPAGFGSLPEFADIRLSPGARLPRWRHGPADLLTQVLDGSLAQSDPRGRSSVLQTDEFQRYSIDRLTRLDERNASQTDEVRLLRLFLEPSGPDQETVREQRRVSIACRQSVLRLVASPDGRGGSLRVRQDADVYSSLLDVGRTLIHALSPDRVVWLHVLRGEVTLDDLVLGAGDSVGVAQEPAISFRALTASEVLLFDLGRIATAPGALRAGRVAGQPLPGRSVT